MSDRSPIDDPLVSFDQQSSSPTVTTPTKPKSNDFYENRSLKDIDPFGSHNGNDTSEQEYHASNGKNTDEHHNGTTDDSSHNQSNAFSLNDDLFPVDKTENEHGKFYLKNELYF